MRLQQGLVRLQHVGLSFSPAGLLTPFHLGVRAHLERVDLPGALQAYDRSRTPFSGASGGAIAAASAALDMDPREALRACVQVSDTFEAGATLRGALDPVLEELIPQDAVPMLQARQAAGEIAAAAEEEEVVGGGGTAAPGFSFGSSRPVPSNRLTVSYFEVYPQRRARHVTTFGDRSDLIDCLRASCSVPLYFNGIAGLPSRVRGGWAVDGTDALLPSCIHLPSSLFLLTLTLTLTLTKCRHLRIPSGALRLPEHRCRVRVAVLSFSRRLCRSP